MNIERNFFDSHIHFNLYISDPVGELISTIRKSQLDGFELILNSQHEVDLFLNNKDRIDELEVIYGVAVLFDYKNEQFGKFYKKIRKKCNNVSIKIHPRLSLICHREIELIGEKLNKYDFDVIIVDCFPYTSNTEHFIDLDIAIYLAKQFTTKKIVLAHSGGCLLLYYMMKTRDIENIIYDLSLSILYFRYSSISLDIQQLIKFTSSRCILGSDYPDFEPTDVYCEFERVANIASLSVEEIQNVACFNAMQVYGLV